MNSWSNDFTKSNARVGLHFQTLPTYIDAISHYFIQNNKNFIKDHIAMHTILF